MSLEQISRALKYANVPYCKVVNVTYPNPRIVIHVPQSHLIIMTGVVSMMQMFVETKVTLLESNDVKPGEHVLIKVKDHSGMLKRQPGESRETHARNNRRFNLSTVVECASAFA